MAGKATTFRIEPAAMEGLAKLSTILNRPLNKLANEAIREYVARRSIELERELETTLEDLRAYRRRDPDFEQSIAKFVEAELSVKDDPAEGSVFIEENDGAESSRAGPAQRAVLKALND